MEQMTAKQIKSYTMGDMLGAGAFGAVYYAQQAVLEREVAIKVIWPAFANHPNFIRAFEAEAQIVASLEHPNIVPIYDYWREPTGAYIVMRMLRGGHLREVLLMDEQPRALQEIVPIINQIALALAHAHRYGIIHRDIKPENILLDEFNNAYLTDFGIAQILQQAKEEHETDDPFADMGSPAYAAPEQLTNQATSPATDLFSLGIILYELLAGEHPYPDLHLLSSTELLKTRIHQPIPSLNAKRPDLPPEIDVFLAKATALNPTERYQDASEFIEGFRQVGIIFSDSNASQIVNQLQAIKKDIPNPYKGLQTFQEADAHNFFGREKIIKRIIAHLNGEATHEKSERFITIIGPSGSGKSSVVRAGIIPQIRQDALPNSNKWFIADMIPGTQPFLALQNALSRIATNLPEDLEDRLRHSPRGLHEAVEEILPDDPEIEFLLLIDQFEEVFTLGEQQDEIKLFLQNIRQAVLAANSRFRVIVTLRADFYDRPLRYAEISDLVRENTEVIVPLSKKELQRTVINPAQQAGVEVDPDVVATITEQLAKQPGVLPMLSYTLSELFEQREHGRITLDAYQALGGVNGALAQRTEQLFREFDELEREAARQLFLRLVTLGEGTEDTRRRALLVEFHGLGRLTRPIQVVIERMGKARMLTFDYDRATHTPTLEVAHEAIIREWGRLRDWLNESREDVRMQRNLALLAEEWENGHKDPSFLLHGSRLRQFEKWNDTSDIILTAQEKTFLQGSLDERDHQLQVEEERRIREQNLEERALLRLRLLAGFLFLGVLLALGLVGVAVNQNQIAAQEREDAEDAREISEANALESQVLAMEASARDALNNNASDLAIVLAYEASQLNRGSLDAWDTLSTVALAPGTRMILGVPYSSNFSDGHLSWVSGVAFSPDGALLASSSWDGTVRLWDLTTSDPAQQQRFIMAGHNGDVEDVDFSPTGEYLISGAVDFQAILWDVATGQEVRRFIGHTGNVRTVEFTPDGRQAVTGGADRLLILWNVQTGQEVQRFEGHQFEVRDASFSLDGQWMVSAGREAFLWNLAGEQEPRRLELPDQNIKTISISPDNRLLATGSDAGNITLWDSSTGAIIDILRGENGEIETVRFTPDGLYLMSDAIDGSVSIWRLDTFTKAYQLNGHIDSAVSLTISDNGYYAASGSKDFTIRVWNISGQADLQRVTAHDQRVTGVAFTPNQQDILTASIDGQLKTWNIATGLQQNSGIATNDAPIRAIATSQDDTWLAAGQQDGTILLHNLHNGQEMLIEGDTSPVLAAAISPNNKFLAFGTQAGTLFIWDIEAGVMYTQLASELGAIYALDFGEDNDQVLAGTRDGGVILWSVALEAEIRRLAGHAGTVYAVDLNSNANRAVSGDIDGAIYIWDLADGTRAREFLLHQDSIWAVKFLPQDNLIVSASADPMIYLWDAKTGQVGQILVPNSIPYALDLNPATLQIAVGEEDGHFSLWQLYTHATLLDWVENNRYLRPLTPIECERYRVDVCQ